MNNIDLDQRIAVVTGGAQGIGRAITELLSACGARVEVWDMAAADDLNCAGQVSLDVTDCAAVAQAAQAAVERYDRVDILVNNAGIAGSTVPLAEYDPVEWQRIVEIDLVGVFHCCRALVPSMVDRGYGRIVNMASLAGKEGTPNASAYSAAKAGVIALTKSLGKELAQTGVLVNCIAPAAIKTDILQQMSPAHVQTMIDKSPMQRLGTVEEAAQMTAWLVSDAISFNTGACFDLSGGRATY
ncbi:MAG: SDR family NAD(P)-dependent oxidoreductase [Gammaproteobacteria bacterium]